MLVCKDELRRIAQMTKRKTQFFDDLLKDVQQFEDEDVKLGKKLKSEEAKSAVYKVKNALKRTQRQREAFEQLLAEIKEALESVGSSDDYQRMRVETDNPFRFMSFAPYNNGNRVLSPTARIELCS